MYGTFTGGGFAAARAASALFFLYPAKDARKDISAPSRLSRVLTSYSKERADLKPSLFKKNGKILNYLLILVETLFLMMNDADMAFGFCGGAACENRTTYVYIFVPTRLLPAQLADT